MNEMRRLIDLIESAQAEAELLDEGPVGKALATAALALGLQFGQQVNAEEVYVYQDAQGELQTVQSFMQIPDEAQMSYVIDTDTKQIKYIKKPAGGDDSKSDASNLPQPLQDMMAGVKKVAKDPESVTFSDLGVYTLANGKKVYVGYYNAKNSFGGYGGKRIMMFAPDGTGSQYEKGGEINLRWQPLGMSAMRLGGVTVVVPDFNSKSGDYPGYIDKDRPVDENFRLGLKFITTLWGGSVEMEKDMPKKYRKEIGIDPLFNQATFTKINY